MLAFVVTRAMSDRGEPLAVADGRYETVTGGQNKNSSFVFFFAFYRSVVVHKSKVET